MVTTTADVGVRELLQRRENAFFVMNAGYNNRFGSFGLKAYFVGRPALSDEDPYLSDIEQIVGTGVVQPHSGFGVAIVSEPWPPYAEGDTAYSINMWKGTPGAPRPVVDTTLVVKKADGTQDTYTGPDSLCSTDLQILAQDAKWFEDLIAGRMTVGEYVVKGTLDMRNPFIQTQ